MKVKLFPPFFTMLSTADLERLITVKRLEIEKEKTALGLSPPVSHAIDNKENVSQRKPKKQVSLAEKEVLSEYDDNTEEKRERERNRLVETEDYISPDLERYIRRYLGLPVMLKAGEYSPNNPLIRGERPSGDVLLGLGEYERRRNTLRKLRQQQYREYLDQQAKKKQDAKEQAEKERREQEEKERQREEEKERQREEEIERQREKREQENRTSKEFRRASTCYVTSAATSSNSYKTKVDTGVQVGISRPLSVAVQTDDSDLYRLTPSPTKSQLTQAERELSPRTVEDPLDERPVQPAPWLRGCGAAEREEGVKGDRRGSQAERRRSYGDFDERSSATVKRTNRDKLQSDLRHTYMPSIFDADAIQRRNVQAEKDAAERRQFYQQELKSQILEQQRIKEERKTREKMLEQAEMRRLEEQLRMLKVAQEREIGKQHVINTAINDNAMDYNKKRKSLQQEIDVEHQKLIRVAAQMNNKRTTTAHSDTSHQTRQPSKLPFYYPTIYQRSDDHQKPYSTNIPDNSIFSPNYDVDTYLRRNLNPSRETLMSSRLDNSKNKDKNLEEHGCEIIEKAIVHERPRKRSEKPKYEPSFMRNLDKIEDETPIPVLKVRSSERDVRCENDVRRENNVRSDSDVRDDNLSDAMKIVDDKWKVPAVQKNILKSIPNEEGKSVSILTQLGSIRRQLQLEQLKLDNMATKNSEG